LVGDGQGIDDDPHDGQVSVPRGPAPSLRPTRSSPPSCALEGADPLAEHLLVEPAAAAVFPARGSVEQTQAREHQVTPDPPRPEGRSPQDLVEPGAPPDGVAQTRPTRPTALAGHQRLRLLLRVALVPPAPFLESLLERMVLVGGA